MADFLLFRVPAPVQAPHGLALPVAVIYRFDAAVIGRIRSVMAFVRATIPVEPERVRWLSQVCFDSEGSLAPVPGFFDGEVDNVVYLGGVENISEDENGGCDVYGDACQIYETAGSPIRSSGLTVLQTALPDGVLVNPEITVFADCGGASGAGPDVIGSPAVPLDRIMARLPVRAVDCYSQEVLRQPRLMRALLGTFADSHDMRPGETPDDYLRRCAEADFGNGVEGCHFPEIYGRAVEQARQSVPEASADRMRMSA